MVSRLEVGSPKSSTSGVGESEEDASNGDKLQQSSNGTEAGVCSLPLLDPFFLTSLAHTLELEVSGVSSWASTLALKKDEHDSTNNRDEVERQVHDISDDGAGSELGKRLLDEFAQTADSVSAATDLALLGHEFGLALGDQSAVECVNQALLNEECFREGVEYGATLVQAQQSGINSSQRSVEDCKDSSLGKVSEEEDTSECGKTESDSWDEFGCERLPELAFREEVEDALEYGG